MTFKNSQLVVIGNHIVDNSIATIAGCVKLTKSSKFNVLRPKNYIQVQFFTLNSKIVTKKMRGDRLRRPYRQEHRHATADGVHVVGDVAAEDDVC